ncbi:MAG: protein kinase [Bacteroidia bacterium]|nr:protein kinase [Bacteroidia bacterium]
MGTLKPETIFSERYLSKRQLGVGGFSEVWLAQDIKTGNLEVALKIFAPEKGLDAKGIEVFSREYSLVFNLNHPHLLVPKHFDIFDGSPYLVMPYCRNGSLIEKIGEMTEEELVRFIQQSASALAYLHSQEPPIIHQDIKPDNFLIDNNDNYLLADFGISSKIRHTLTKSMGKASSGTMAYMSPEKWTRERQIIKAGDVFSLGVTLYEIASGELPFGEQGGLVLNTGAEIPDLPQSFSPELNNIVRSCMAKEPWERPTAEKLEKIALEYLKNGKWKHDKKNIPEEKVPPLIENIQSQPDNKVQIENEKNVIANKKPSSSRQRQATWIIPTILGVIISILIFATFFYYFSGPSAKELEEKRITDSIRVTDSLVMVKAEQQRIVDSIAKAQEEQRINDSIIDQSKEKGTKQETVAEELIDPRDGQRYRTVKIGKYTWMAENLNFFIADESWCYENNSYNCSIYGRIYSYNAAENACPKGWSISSSNGAWDNLTNLMYGKPYTLKKIQSSGFDVLLGGYRGDTMKLDYVSEGINFGWYNPSIKRFSFINEQVGFWCSGIWSISQTTNNELAKITYYADIVLFDREKVSYEAVILQVEKEDKITFVNDIGFYIRCVKEE